MKDRGAEFMSTGCLKRARIAAGKGNFAEAEGHMPMSFWLGYRRICGTLSR